MEDEALEASGKRVDHVTERFWRCRTRCEAVAWVFGGFLLASRPMAKLLPLALLGPAAIGAVGRLFMRPSGLRGLCEAPARAGARGARGLPQAGRQEGPLFMAGRIQGALPRR